MFRQEARKKGYSVVEQAQQDGSIKIQIIEGWDEHATTPRSFTSATNQHTTG
jgi:hypothetical protein